MPRFIWFLTLCLATFVCFQLTQLSPVMAAQTRTNPDQADHNAQTQSTSDPNKQKTPPASPKKKSPPPPKGGDNSPSYLWEIHSIAPSNNGEEIEKLIGNPKPFTVKARDARTLLIYSPTTTLTPADRRVLERVYADIARLSEPPSKTEELEVPHYRALGDLATRAKKLNYPGITVQAAGDNKLRINRASWVTDQEYDEFTSDLMAMGMRLSATSPASQLYYISAAEAASALGAGQSDKGSDKSSGDKTNSGGGSTTTVSSDNTSTQTKNSGPSPKPKARAATAEKGSADSADAGSGDAGDANGDPSGGSANGGSDSGGKKPSVSISTLNPDLLVFGVDHPGDDAEISEKKRILAALDFPRPEVIINTFSFQTSASQSKVLTDENRRLQVEVGRYNDGIQMALNRTWLYLQGRSTESSFFDTIFLNYLRMRFVADKAEPDKWERHSGQYSGTSSKPSGVINLPDEARRGFDICPANEYCLGYSSLFRPIRPNLTDMLLAVISSADPAKEIRLALSKMENVDAINIIQGTKLDEGWLKQCSYDCEKKLDDPPPQCDERDVFILRKAAILERGKKRPAERHTDQVSDDAAAQSWPKQSSATAAPDSAPNIMPLFCFREEIDSAFPDSTGSNNAARLLRSTLANFLFQYKWSRQYPHDFSAYELNESAQALNSQLNPLIVAFNRDLAAALRPLEDVADFSGCRQEKCNSGKNRFWFWQGNDTRFVNNGIITVRTVSGKETIVDTVTQNFFDATELPSIADLISSVGQAESNVPTVLKANVTAHEAAVITGALNSVKPAVAKVGREFKIDITPHSLSGASAAELDLKMLTGDQADPTRYSNGKSDPDNLSRVAQQTTNTKVRLESIKLFEISSFSATLQRSRKNIPIIPPLFEIPYIGSVLSLPVAGGKQFHRSTAVMSAVVVPTAADLATALEFTHDRVLVAPPTSTSTTPTICCDEKGVPIACLARPAYSPEDLRNASIWEYNRQKVQCFGIGGACGTLNFAGLLPQ
jgi:hypothetical protein